MDKDVIVVCESVVMLILGVWSGAFVWKCLLVQRGIPAASILCYVLFRLELRSAYIRCTVLCEDQPLYGALCCSRL